MSVLAVAHRAGNSGDGLRRANDLRVDVIECDVHHHRGRLEVRHLKTAGPLPFLWDRWELQPGWRPRLGLEELLGADRRGAVLMVDLKGARPDAGRSVARLLHELGVDQPLWVCGRWWPGVQHVADELDYVRPVLSARNRWELRRLRRRVAAGPPAYGVSVHLSLLDREVVADLRRHVHQVLTWPVDDFGALRHAQDVGVTGVISEEPAVLAEVVHGRERRT